MDLFRFLGDFCHLYSILILIYKIHTRKTTAGISLRTRVLYLFVFLARYGDLFLYYISFYNTFMKILYLSATAYIIYLMTINPNFKNTWYHDLDNMSTLPLVVGSAILGVICTSRYSVFEIMWTFSIVLESVAILPQIDHLTKVPTLPALPLSHLVALGLYRFFYVLNWVFRIGSDGAWYVTAFFFGLIQTVIWADFLWVWYNRKQIKLAPNTNGQGLRSQEEGVTGDGQQVDAGDMSKSFVLTHIITFTQFIEQRFLGGRKIPGLSISAYPDQTFGRQAASGPYSDSQHDAIVPGAEIATNEYVIRVPSPALSTSDEGPQQMNVTPGQTTNETLGLSSPIDGSVSAVTATTQLFAPQPITDEDGFSVQSDDGTTPPP